MHTPAYATRVFAYARHGFEEKSTRILYATLQRNLRDPTRSLAYSSAFARLRPQARLPTQDKPSLMFI